MHATVGRLVELGAVTTESRGRAAYPRLTDRGRELLTFAAAAALACDAALGIDGDAAPGLYDALARVARQALPRDDLQLD